MAPVLIGLGIAALAASGTIAAPRAQPPMILALGIGHESCAHWLESQDLTFEGIAWVYGYWTALNQYAGPNVGGTTDAAGIVGEIKLICNAEPSTPL